MTAKEYLSRYHKMVTQIKSMKLEVVEFKRLANSLPSMNFDSIRVDETKKHEAPFIKWIDKIIDKELHIRKLEERLPIVKSEIIQTIDSLENPDLKRLLIFRYIDSLSWNEISNQMFVSTSTLKRRHIKAQKLLTKIK